MTRGRAGQDPFWGVCSLSKSQLPGATGLVVDTELGTGASWGLRLWTRDKRKFNWPDR